MFYTYVYWQLSIAAVMDGILSYSQEVWQGIKFGGLAVYITTAKLKFTKISYSYIHMAIPYRTAKFKSANIFIHVIVIWGSSAKFNFRQYFRLYGII